MITNETPEREEDPSNEAIAALSPSLRFAFAEVKIYLLHKVLRVREHMGKLVEIVDKLNKVDDRLLEEIRSLETRIVKLEAGATQYESIRRRLVYAGVCPVCVGSLDLAEGFHLCPRCGWSETNDTIQD